MSKFCYCFAGITVLWLFLQICGIIWFIYPSTHLCPPKKRDHSFNDNLNNNRPFATIFGTHHWDYRPLTDVFIFPPHLLSAAALPWQTAET